MSEKLYKKIPQPKNWRGEDKELEKIIADQNNALRMITLELERLQKEKKEV